MHTRKTILINWSTGRSLVRKMPSVFTTSSELEIFDNLLATLAATRSAVQKRLTFDGLDADLSGRFDVHLNDVATVSCRLSATPAVT